jgi:pyruvate dehydrogenase E1 component alpha subunit
VFLEFATYRWLEHCGPSYDNHIGYRTEAEFEAWRAQDPLPRYRQLLITDGVATAAELDAMAEDLSATMEDAVSFAKSSPFPVPEQAALNLYAD